MDVAEFFKQIFYSTGLINLTLGNVVMIVLGLVLIYLAIAKKFEPLLLLPIGIGCILVNLPLSGFYDPNTGLFNWFYQYGVLTTIFPVLIFLGLGALTDFGPLIANPITIFLGGAAQLGIFVSFFFAMLLKFPLKEAASIAIIGGADGPATIFTTIKLAPHLMGPIMLAAYSYMALVPIIQPPFMKLLTTKKERQVVMTQLRPVSKLEKILFPIITEIVIILFVPSIGPLFGMLMLGNLIRECGVVERFSKSAQNEIINVCTLFLALTIGSTMKAENFLTIKTLEIVGLGLAAFIFGTIGGLLLGKLFCFLSGGKINPLIGSAGVAAVPMAARVTQDMARKENLNNYLLMHAMGPNVAGLIGSAAVAGLFITLFAG